MKKYLLIFIFLFISSNLFASENFLQLFYFTYQNDSVYNEDYYYTNGVEFFFKTKNFKTQNENFHNYNFGIAQNIYTPYNRTATEKLENDRPYAGYLYTFLEKNIYHSKNITDKFGIYLGLTGPSSLSEEVQTKIHKLIGSDIPQGWNNQLSNELLFMINWTKSFEFEKNYNNYKGNFIPSFSINLGTPFTGATLSGEYRFTFDKNDYILLNLENSKLDKFNYFYYIKTDLNLNIYNTFINGNLGKRTNLDLQPISLKLNLGVNFNINKFYFDISTYLLTEEFKQQETFKQIIFSAKVGLLF